MIKKMETQPRAAGYGRFSSDNQKKASIADQFRQLRRGAAEQGWNVLDEYFLSDEGLSGATLIDRTALQSLIDHAKRRPRPFEVLMIDDTSRLGRNLTLVLKILEELSGCGIFLYFVSQRLDSRDQNFRQMFIMNGMMDEQFLVGLKAKVHRGQEGRFLNDMIPGGKCYGYKHIPIEDPSRKGEYGRPAVIGVKREIHPEEANQVRRIYDMYGTEQLSLIAITKRLNAEGVPRPEPRTIDPDHWCLSTVRSILLNERYLGIMTWNKTRKDRAPGDYRTVTHKRPEEEWLIREIPELRIVSDEQWKKVKAQLELVHEMFSVARLGGLNRIPASHNYLFSGSMTCGCCKGPIVVVGGSHSNMRYGCRNHRFRGTCINSLTIKRTELEKQLIESLVTRFLQPEMIEMTIAEFDKQLQIDVQRSQRALQNAKSSMPALQIELRRIEKEINNLLDSLKRLGADFEPSIGPELRRLQDRKEAIKSQVNIPEIKMPQISKEQVRRFVLEKTKCLEAVLLGDRPAAKKAIQKYIGNLVFTPQDGPDGLAYAVNGAIRPFSDPNDVMLLVAPRPTPPITNRSRKPFRSSSTKRL
jgi:site-specific DNA recombinase